MVLDQSSIASIIAEREAIERRKKMVSNLPRRDRSSAMLHAVVVPRNWMRAVKGRKAAIESTLLSETKLARWNNGISSTIKARLACFFLFFFSRSINPRSEKERRRETGRREENTFRNAREQTFVNFNDEPDDYYGWNNFELIPPFERSILQRMFTNDLRWESKISNFPSILRAIKIGVE